jgi:hypothetical protein
VYPFCRCAVCLSCGFQFVLGVKSGCIRAIFVTLSIGINSKWSKKYGINFLDNIEEVATKDALQFCSGSTREYIRVYLGNKLRPKHARRR